MAEEAPARPEQISGQAFPFVRYFALQRSLTMELNYIKCGAYQERRNDGIIKPKTRLMNSRKAQAGEILKYELIYD